MNTKQSVRQYGCVKCQTTHTEPDPLFQEHIIHQSKHGWKWVAVEPGRNQPANNTKHTPGPWRFAGLNGGMETIEGKVFGVENIPIAAAFYETRDMRVPQTQEYGDQVRANARLIAAAPELLEACKVLADLCTDAKCVQSVKWTSARDQARAAIQKAEGTV